ncbi:glutathione S-transferase 1-1-like [Osmia bicornis bicornis]|uniref:glutathione S-transferase 1-1-like n=1 Tax=Osmia bicornis bicornis TaxID=1437191 RepID=UPI0010F8DD5C|nr:glutathione S-transferase 1-1-like [Osmia bicornis bicornis]XP_029039564.1 glutathione S-transferase 1-1-like [Osmia bicornis bicornis]XP_029039565.1 glutathione S-transferase 1-1-like [Osmia bicornis bicornis]
MSVDLYYAPMSSPCRAVLLTAEAIGFPLNLKKLNLFAGEHQTPEYEELNPQKTVPFILDGDYKLTESRAIMSYLVDQYGKNDRLNPHTPNERALVNQRLHFDIGTLYKAAKYCYYPVVFRKMDYDPEQYKELQNAFEILDKLLEGNDYATGRNMTIADLALVATVSTVETFDFEVGNYPNVAKWLERTKSSAPGYRKANGEGLKLMRMKFEDLKKK